MPVVPKGESLDFHDTVVCGSGWSNLVVSPVHVDFAMKLVHSIGVDRSVSAVRGLQVVTDVEGYVTDVRVQASKLITTEALDLYLMNLDQSRENRSIV